jgi:molybdenum cofactor cytidylyltransferase
MPGGSKLLLPWRGKPLVRWAAETLVRAGLSPIVAVSGGDHAGVAAALRGLPVTLVENPRHREGMGTSLAAGAAALGREVEAAAVALGDMPLVAEATVRRLVEAYRSGGGSVVIPVWEGRRGHPVLFDLGHHRAALLALRGDEGARSLVAARADEIREVPVDDDGILLDVDTPADYRILEARQVLEARPPEFNR